ncbi:hypothetical protein PanWU01x14_071450 [Parasponia andersonii]|uniref:Uncharacterized protein n=1 Tax=Parasponia andersonii TaxID=3476 RepID=A0A2P5DEK3_PARAD|nr:hypothetical protein PanWU01x14_071450 [Parasponia andersonii]
MNMPETFKYSKLVSCPMALQTQTLPPNPESAITTELIFQNLRPQRETKRNDHQTKTPVSESVKPTKLKANIFNLRKKKWSFPKSKVSNGPDTETVRAEATTGTALRRRRRLLVSKNAKRNTERISPSKKALRKPHKTLFFSHALAEKKKHKTPEKRTRSYSARESRPNSKRSIQSKLSTF